MSIDLSQFHQAFFEEALSGLDQAEEDLLGFERGSASTEAIGSAFRAIHSIKGTAASLGFEQMGALAHELEAVLDEYRALATKVGANQSDPADPFSDALHRAIRVEKSHVSVMLSGLDLLRTQINNAQQKLGDISSSRLDVLNSKLRQIIKDLQVAPSQVKTFDIFFQPTKDMLCSGNDPLRYLDTLASLGDLQVIALWKQPKVHLPERSSALAFDPSTCHLNWQMKLKTTRTQEQVKSVFEWVEDLCSLSIQLAKPDQAIPRSIATYAEEAAGSQIQAPIEESEASGSRAQRSIQVPAERIDQLLGQLGDLAIFQSEIEDKLVTREVEDLFQRLNRHTRTMQDAILAMRMSPIGTLFKRFERVIRDAKLELGKEVQVQVLGENNELDSSMIERLIDPMTHLIRNALDHGIETSDQRLAAGKPPLAQLKLSAEQKSNHFVMTIEDDGKGLDLPAIRQRAIERELVKEQDHRSDSQWAQLIFSPGFSTTNTVNHWSGRGVGLDAVLTAISQMNGHLQVHSRPGQGTRFTISIPLTLALTDALIVACGNERYAIALSAVSECLQADHRLVQTLPNQQKLYPQRGRLLPYIDLQELMGLGSGPTPEESFSALEIASGNENAILKVSCIVGQRQIVIKSIDKNLGHAKHCHSATLLGDGTVIFVLDPSSILRHSAGFSQAAMSA